MHVVNDTKNSHLYDVKCDYVTLCNEYQSVHQQMTKLHRGAYCAVVTTDSLPKTTPRQLM